MEAKILGIISNNPEVVVNQNDSKNFRKYLNEGFYVVERKDGFCKLKKSGILVKIEYNGKPKVVELQKAIFAYYGKVKLSEAMAKFKADIKNERITIDRDSRGYWILVKK